ncbi:alanine--glyoxylate aminotransferase family protein [Methanonatronarchaeum sp. AMET6-2]|uniref:pyridoxal-phosphate-dependent aminotransferase family protein n=1 Tax=Methanonatronarchaeum sp. AMET6-2 TaxID=2933293 RepID=UPI001203824F|nr:alanine--glyoxylate aminotransferase family protein [Methanonatronarchaeum sp. AMET6-2]RZN62906.1 MAG: alanine--glyoxylate aminotransferase family protein [Methanonatronarchaeia archaeon]UOY09836.1 alanine--glyoxylate aminotransferase family protein [Methanonatronarchaeum sp. AMET6-2]
MDLLMTAGPTEVHPRVRQAMNRRIKSPDFDEGFKDLYRDITDKLKSVYNTDNDVLVLGGEAILGLEATVSSVIDKGDNVLCISNGFFGDGFADFVEMRGGNPVLACSPYNQELDIEKTKELLEKKDFKAATIVHCETPTGILNDLDELLDILNENQVTTIVDAVSSLGGTPVPTDKIDLCIGGSQKCLSNPPGLTTISVSEKAWGLVENHEQDTYYTSLEPWKKKWLEKNEFPYSHLVTNLYALNESLDILLEEGLENVYRRHKKTQEACIELCMEKDLDFYPEDIESMSPTVTALKVDNSLKLQEKIKQESKILLSTGLGDLEKEILRIGHMGYNADEHKVRKTINAIEKAF